MAAMVASKIEKVADPEQRKQLTIQAWKDLLALIQQASDLSLPGTREPRFLEYLVWSPESSRLERQVAIYRMTLTQPARRFLPLWESAATMEPEIAHQVSAAALDLLGSKGVSLTDDERARLQALAKPGK